MNVPTPRSPRRGDALSRDRIVEAAIEVLDASGEAGLTFRALTTRLSTGAGAIYHHVTNKDELLAAAADGVLGRALGGARTDADPAAAVRATALGIFDAIDAHPWVGAQLSRDPGQPAVLRIWTALGRQLQELGVTGSARSDAGSALVAYVVGSTAQHAAGARQVPDAEDRQAYLDALAARWTEQDPDALVGEAAALLAEHDDRAQFLAGVDIFLAGVRAGLSAGTPAPARGEVTGPGRR